MKIDDRFSPTIAAIGQPNNTNFLKILGEGTLDYKKNKEDDVLREIKMEDIKNKVSDDKSIVKYKEHLDGGGNRRTWAEGGNSFLTSTGALAAEGIDRGRAKDRLAENKYGLSVRKANAPKRGRRGNKSAMPLFDYNTPVNDLNAKYQPSKKKGNESVPAPKMIVIVNPNTGEKMTVEDK